MLDAHVRRTKREVVMYFLVVFKVALSYYISSDKATLGITKHVKVAFDIPIDVFAGSI